MLSRADPHQELPRRHPPGARAPGPRPPHGAHHRRPRLRGRAAQAAVRRHRVAPRSTSVDDGRYTGQMLDVPPTGESRASALFDYAARHDIDLAEAVAYADSSNDLPMLEVVGFPVAVNPETRLASLARKRGWLVEQWAKAAGGAELAPARWPATAAPPRRAPDEGAALRAQAGPVRGRRGGRPDRARARARRWARCSWPTSTSPSCRPTTGCGCGPASPASAAATWPPSTADSQPLLRADRVVPVHARPRGRGRPRRRQPGRARPGAVVRDPRHRPGLPGVRRRRAPTTASASPSATSSPACRAASARTPAAAGPPRWSPTRASCSPCPTAMTDEAAVMVEPTACAVHAARGRCRPAAGTVAVIGAGTLGLLTIAALRGRRRSPPRSWPPPSTRTSRRWPPSSAPTRWSSPSELGRAVRSRHRVVRASAASSPTASTWWSTASAARPASPRPSRWSRPGGEVLVVGMPGHTALDLTTLWHRETVAAGLLRLHPSPTSSGALDLVGRGRPRPARVSATYPLARYTEAIEHAANAGAAAR